jgi:hypothetical protein
MDVGEGYLKKKEQSVADLVKMFADSVLKHAEFMFKDSDVANRHYARFMRAIKGLHRLGKPGLSALCDLLSDDRLVVRVTALLRPVTRSITVPTGRLRSLKRRQRRPTEPSQCLQS